MCQTGVWVPGPGSLRWRWLGVVMTEQSGRRPALSRAHSEEKRDGVYRLRLNSTERKMLDAAAALHGMKLSRYLVEAGRSMGRGSDMAERQAIVTELMGIRSLLGRTASNINQIARHANSTGEFPDDAEAAVRFAKDLMRRIDDVVVELS